MRRRCFGPGPPRLSADFPGWRLVVEVAPSLLVGGVVAERRLNLAEPCGAADDGDVDDPEALIDRSHQAWAEFITGDPSLALELFSRRDDVTIANPFVPYSLGWEQASATIAKAAAYFRDGEVVGYERVATYRSADLVCILEIERYRAKIGGSDEMSPFSYRVSTVVRREADGWRIAGRHADPITSMRPPESLLEGSGHA
jgi:ketosteroid isomerase-like protein